MTEDTPVFFSIRILPPDAVLGSVEAQRRWAADVAGLLGFLTPIDPSRVMVIGHRDPVPAVSPSAAGSTQVTQGG